MLEEADDLAGQVTSEEAFSVLRDLERNTPEEIRRQRSHFRLAIKAGVILQPGNASQLLTMKVRGVTGDVSSGGCSALFPIPVTVGDIYRLQFDRVTLDLPLTFARCVRCRLIREDAFEGGFAFFSAISLPERVSTATQSSLIQ